MFLLFVMVQALAQQPMLGDLQPVQAPHDVAEYQRQSAELQMAATRNAWTGVERAYRALITTHVPLTGAMHLGGAHAAQDRGDMTATRDRIRQALHAEPEFTEATDWLSLIESQYASVLLLGDHTVHRLEADATPFDPVQAEAIRFATSAVADTGTFIGLLPGGTYRFGELELEVRPGITTQRIDLRSDRTLRRAAREERREAR